MASLSFIIGIIGNVISILVFASPIKTFREIVKKKSTENYKSVPYITTLLTTSLWTFYGILKPGGLLVATVNGVGVIVQIIYVTLFFTYAPKAKKVKTAKLVGLLNIGFLGVVILVTLLVLHGDLRITFTGILCAALTILMYASPLAAMGIVIKTKSVAYMPFFLSFFLFLNACVWLVYAILVKDLYIGTPNVMGFVLGLIQLGLYAAYYKNKTPLEKFVEEEEEKKGDIEIPPYDHNVTKDGNLNKVTSIPKTSSSRQHSLEKIARTFSMSQYELPSTRSFGEKNVGNDNHHDNRT